VRGTRRSSGIAFGHANDEWTPDQATAVASSVGLTLGPSHWRVIGCARELWAMTRQPLDLELLAARLGCSVGEVAALFPRDAPNTLGLIAGIHE
jgi:sulfur relay (sulfurtransferase) DsrC/TusE family protein